MAESISLFLYLKVPLYKYYLTFNQILLGLLLEATFGVLLLGSFKRSIAVCWSQCIWCSTLTKKLGMSFTGVGI